MILAVILVFVSVFLFALAIFGGSSKPKVDTNQRMNRYINAVTADVRLELEKKGESKNKGYNKANNFFRSFLEKYGKTIEKKGYTKQIEFELQKGDIPLRGYEFLFLIGGTTGAAIFLTFIFNPNMISMSVAGLLGFMGPIIFMRIKQAKKVQLFNNQIGDALVLISNSLKAGYGFMQSLEMVSRDMRPPIQTEFGRVLQEINLGITTEEALTRLTVRVCSKDLDLVVTAMLIQRQIGGNLSEILDNISHTIRERIRIKGEIKSLTAQGRLSGLIIGAMPLAISAFLLITNPQYVTQLVTDPRGKFLIIYAVVAEVIAILLIRKIVSIKI